MKKLLLTILYVLICPLAVNAVNYVQISKNIESAWWIANYIFNKAYNMYFSPEVQAKYGAKHT